MHVVHERTQYLQHRSSSYDWTTRQSNILRRRLNRNTNHLWLQHVSGHFGVGNSKDLEVSGVIRDTPDPGGGVICGRQITSNDRLIRPGVASIA